MEWEKSSYNFYTIVISDWLVWFYSISTLLGYLVPNPVYTSRLNNDFKTNTLS